MQVMSVSDHFSDEVVTALKVYVSIYIIYPLKQLRSFGFTDNLSRF